MKSAFIFPILILIISLSATISELPKVEACGNNTPCTNTVVKLADNMQIGSSTHTTASLPSWYSGDMIVVRTWASTAGVTISSLTNSNGDTFVKDFGATIQNPVEVWHAVVGGICSSCAFTVTITWTGSQTYTWGVYRSRSIANYTSATYTASRTSPGTSLSFSPNNIPGAGIAITFLDTLNGLTSNYAMSAPFTYTLGTGANGWGSGGVCGSGCYGVNNPGYYFTSVYVPSTTATWSWTTSAKAEAVMVVYSSIEPVATVVASCTFFQLQCWWYPLLFMSLYSGMLLMVAHWVKASPKGKAHIFMSALTYGSLIAVILGIMNIVFPLLMLILNTIIVLRLRGS